MKLRIFAVLGIVAALSQFGAAAQSSYQKPPQDIIDVVMAPSTPLVRFNEQGTMGVIQKVDSPYLPISEYTSMDEYRIAGIRVNARNFTASRYKTIIRDLTLVKVDKGEQVKIAGLPSDGKFFDVKWSPDGKAFCFLNYKDTEVELYHVDATSKAPTARKINVNKVNATFDNAYKFMPDGKVLYKAVPADLGAFPDPKAPRGPIVQRSDFKVAKYKTYQDLLKNVFDEEVFDYLCSSVFCLWDGSNSRVIGKSAVIRDYSPSPDGQYIFVVYERKPYSYTKNHKAFGAVYAAWDIAGQEIRVFKKSASAGTSKVKGKIDYDAPKDSAKVAAAAEIEEDLYCEDEDEKKVTTTKSGYGWRADAPATVVWIETENQPDKPAPKDDDDDDTDDDDDADKAKDKKKDEPKYTTALWQFEAPFKYKSQKKMLFKSEYKMSDVRWCDESLAIYTETNKAEKFKRMMAFAPADTSITPQEVYRWSTEPDSLGTKPIYGKPVMTVSKEGQRILKTNSGSSVIFLLGDNRPDENGDKMYFVDALSIGSGKMTNLWTNKAPYREAVTKVISGSGKDITMITHRQSPKECPNYFKVTAKGAKVASTPITSFANPLPQMASVIDTFIFYTRKDGIKCSGRLFLPPGYDKERDGKLPVIMWTYPEEFKYPALAEKHRGLRYNFPIPGRANPCMWALKGYAVLKDFSMLIVSKDSKSKPYDDLVNQMVMSAEAAIDALDAMGVGDRNRVAVGGHSFGAFMTCNLMTHSKLFKAGIAESGAYNRTLTPFGFQHSERIYWKARKMYDSVSPFNYADKLSGHLLLVHGTLDENTGTHPIQSERMYYAAAGAGKDVDYIQLPYEGHTYVYEENLLHHFNETYLILEKYVKNAK